MEMRRGRRWGGDQIPGESLRIRWLVADGMRTASECAADAGELRRRQPRDPYAEFHRSRAGRRAAARRRHMEAGSAHRRLYVRLYSEACRGPRNAKAGDIGRGAALAD